MLLASTSLEEESKLSDLSSLSIDNDILLEGQLKKVAQPAVQGNCYLKTKTGAFKQHFFSVKGDRDIEFRKKRNFKLKLTVCLSTCHLRLIKFSSSHTLKGRFHPLQIDVSESHSRLLYFTSEAA